MMRRYVHDGTTRNPSDHSDCKLAVVISRRLFIPCHASTLKMHRKGIALPKQAPIPHPLSSRPQICVLHPKPRDIFPNLYALNFQSSKGPPCTMPDVSADIARNCPALVVLETNGLN